MLKYIAKQTVFHILFTGAVYLALRAPWLAIQDHFIWLFTALISGAAFYFDVKWYRPIPTNPVQQFLLNFYIIAYGFLVAFFLSVMSEFSRPGGLTALIITFPIYYYLLLGLVTRVDYAEMKDLHDREYSQWERELIEAFRKASQ